MMDTVDIKMLQVGEAVDNVFVLKKMVERDSGGNPFLLFQFGNSTGTLNGVMWGGVERVVRQVRVGDVIRVRGEIQEYQGGLQVRVHRLDPVDEKDLDPSRFLPRSVRDAEKILETLSERARSIQDIDLRRVVAAFFEDDAFLDRFASAPAGRAWHHSYLGGLAEHVHDMLRLADTVMEIYPEIDRDLLVAGVLLHDIGKLDELRSDRSIEYTDEGRLLGHVVIGLRMLDEQIARIDGFSPETALRLRHLVASHQGGGEQGSPKVPMTLEALALHFVDDLDAQMTGARQVIGGRNRTSGRWTEYVRLLDRAFYLGRREKTADD
jgi:3'-5' exoribonuclease